MKKVIITGASGNFGMSLIKALKNKYYLILILRKQNHIENIIEENYEIHNVNFSNFKEVEDLCNYLKKENIYALINNAAIDINHSIFKTSYNELLNIFKINCFTPYFLAKEVIPIMIKNQNGRVINISSTLSERTVVNACEYSMTKCALESLARTIAIEFGKYGITSNNVLFNGMKRSMRSSNININQEFNINVKNLPCERLGEYYEFTSIIDYLLTEEASYINGTNIIVDGGKNSWRGEM